MLSPMPQSLTAADGKLYGEPFYGESSFLMYRKDVFAAKGLTMPAHPTWDQVAELAAQADGAQPGMKGICLRGQPGWGQMIAPLTTVVNTFGGTWFTKDWKAEVNCPGVHEATELLRRTWCTRTARPAPPQAGFTECLNDFEQGKVAMWYDATSAAGSLEAPDSPVAGKIGYVPAPVEKTERPGWLYSWAWAMEKAGNTRTTPGSSSPGPPARTTRTSSARSSAGPAFRPASAPRLYANPATARRRRRSRADHAGAIEHGRPDDPGVQPRPATGIQFVGIPEFSDLGDQVSQDLSSAIAGQTDVPSALDQSQKLAARRRRALPLIPIDPDGEPP